MNLQARFEEILELKAIDLRVNTHATLHAALERFVSFFTARGVTDSTELTVRHVIDLINSWRYAPSTRVLQLRRLKFLLRRIGREDLAKEIRTPRLSKQGKPMPYTDEDILAFRSVAEPS